jgi:hypothetical protein
MFIKTKAHRYYENTLHYKSIHMLYIFGHKLNILKFINVQTLKTLVVTFSKMTSFL